MNPAAASVVALILQYKYFILFPITIVEGPVVMVLAGFLYRLGYFSFIPLYLTLILADLVGDFVWYGVGYHFGRSLVQKHGKFLSITEELFHKIEAKFHEHQNKILFISKMTMGFGFAHVTLIGAGIVRVPFKKYVLLNFLGGFIWTGFLMLIGYFFGNLYTVIEGKFKIVSVIALIIIVLGAFYGFSRYMRQRFIQNKI